MLIAAKPPSGQRELRLRVVRADRLRLEALDPDPGLVRRQPGDALCGFRGRT
jgi:hypothetical protein